MSAQNFTDNPRFEEARKKLKVKKLREISKLKEKIPNINDLLKDKELDLSKLRERSSRLLGTSVATGAFLLSPHISLDYLPTPDELLSKLTVSNKAVKTELKSSHTLLTNSLSSILPERPRPLSRNEEKLLEQVFKQVMGINAKASLEGEHLNTTYGYIGAEQHLKRFPGDTLSKHGEGEVLDEGMAPGLGAWRYFAPSEKNMTPELEETEKWYAVVQTLYLPDWNTRQPYLKNWYKYRKVLIVNTENGKAVVASIADSGPAAWTGKHFGGSPEVMHYLGGPRYKKGPVIIFFVDDPENKVPLGPVEYGRMIPNTLS